MTGANDTGWSTPIADIQAALRQRLMELMYRQDPLPSLRAYYWASIGRGVPPGFSDSGSGASGSGGDSGPAVSGPLLAAVIVPIVVVGLVALAALGFMLKQLQRARKRSITGKVSHQAALRKVLFTCTSTIL
jgi:hypothetical protein